MVSVVLMSNLKAKISTTSSLTPYFELRRTMVKV